MKYPATGTIAAAAIALVPTELYAAAGDIGLPGFGRLILSFLVICGLIYALILFLKRFFMRSGGRGNCSMELVGTLPLGQKSKICIVRAGGKALLIGVTGQQINSLAEFDPAELDLEAEDIKGTQSFISCLRKSVSGVEDERTSATG